MQRIVSVIFIIIIPFICRCGNKEETESDNLASPAVTNWKLVFEDDFDGSAVNTANWSMYYSAGHAGNGLRRPEAFSVADGLLTVTAQMKNGVLVSGGMAHKQNYTYGKFEFRVRTEADPSSATSGVVLTWPQSENWPSDGENDIYETLTTASRSPFNTFIHYGADNKQYHFSHDADGTQWHIIAMEWTQDAIRIYRDGNLVYKLTDTNAIAKVPHHLCIQLDAFKTSMTGMVKMYVDWVKIYQPDMSTGMNLTKTTATCFKISPNPISDYLNITSTLDNSLKEVCIYSADGKPIKTFKTTGSKIDCRNLSKGLYFVRINSPQKAETLKFIKK